MTLAFSNLPWLGIAVAFVCSSALGAVWFLALFRRRYLFTLGRPPDEPQSKDLIYSVGPMICNFVVILTSAILMEQLNITTYSAAFSFALLVGFGYLASNTFNIAINPNMPRPIPYSILTGAFHVLAIVLVCVILVTLK